MVRTEWHAARNSTREGVLSILVRCSVVGRHVERIKTERGHIEDFSSVVDLVTKDLGV